MASKQLKLSDYRFMFFVVSDLVGVFLRRGLGDISLRVMKSNGVVNDTVLLDGKSTTVKYFEREIRKYARLHGFDVD